MNDDELKALSKQRRNTAEEILTTYEILTLLSSEGAPHVIGSYALDVMYDEDIDIVVLCANPAQASLHALQSFIKTYLYSKCEYGDFVSFPQTNRPKGYIVNLQTFVNKVKWEIEIWFLNNVDEHLALTKKLQEAITPETKRLILQEKYLRRAQGISKKEKSSINIYTSILQL